MTNRKSKKSKRLKKGHYPLFKIAPNAITLAAICLGLFAIRFSFEQKFSLAVIFIIISSFLDAIDGRLARFLNSASDFGAQLDSLADFVNFGVAPGFILYNWINTYSNIKGFDFAIVLFFAICSAIRLARFNVDLGSKQNEILEKYFFKGVPAPCGALLALLPLFYSFEFGHKEFLNPKNIIFYSFIISLLMASRIPTISIKKIPIKNEYVYLTLLLIGTLIIGLFLEPWYFSTIICIIYLISIPITSIIYLKLTFKENKND